MEDFFGFLEVDDESVVIIIVVSVLVWVIVMDLVMLVVMVWMNGYVFLVLYVVFGLIIMM